MRPQKNVPAQTDLTTGGRGGTEFDFSPRAELTTGWGGAIFDLLLYRNADILSVILYISEFLGPPQVSMGPLGP